MSYKHVQSTFQRKEKKEKNQFRTAVTTITPQINFWGGGEDGEIPREKKGWNKGKQKIKPTRGKQGREWVEAE